MPQGLVRIRESPRIITQEWRFLWFETAGVNALFPNTNYVGKNTGNLATYGTNNQRGCAKNLLALLI